MGRVRIVGYFAIWGAIVGALWLFGGWSLVNDRLNPFNERPVTTQERAAILKTKVTRENAVIQKAVECMPAAAVSELNAMTLRSRAALKRASEQITFVDEDDFQVKMLTNPTTISSRKAQLAFASRYATEEGQCR